MDRLTKMAANGRPYLVKVFESGQEINASHYEIKCIEEAFEKLANYEDLGYQPDQLQVILEYVDSVVRDSKPFEMDKVHIHCGYLRQYIKHGIRFEQSK